MNFERTLATTSRSLSDGDEAAVHPSNGGCDEPAGGSASGIGSSIGTRWFYVMPVAVLFFAYTATLYVARDQHLDQAILGGLANTVPVVLLGSAAWWLIAHKLVGRSVWRQIAGHLCLAAGFSSLALWLLFILLDMINNLSPVHFGVMPFPAPANAWQLLENVTTYAVIAMYAHMRILQRVTVPTARNRAGTSAAGGETGGDAFAARRDGAPFYPAWRGHPAGRLGPDRVRHRC